MVTTLRACSTRLHTVLGYQEISTTNKSPTGVTLPPLRIPWWPWKLPILRVNVDCCYSVAKSCLTLYNSMDCSTPGFPVHHQLLEPTQTHVHRIGDAIHLILCRPLLLLSSVFSIRVFSNESIICNRWPKYWSFSFSISPSNEYSGLISFRMDWLDLLAVQGTLKSLLPIPQFKSINSSALSFLYCPTLTSIHDYWKNHSLD